MAKKVSIATNMDFLESMLKLPKAVQKRAMHFLKAFPRNTKARGYNFKKISQAKNSRMHSARISRSYRAILYVPRKGNTILALWVANHDEAYDWAARHVVEIHPDTGGIQVWPVETVAAPPPTNGTDATARLFDAYKDRQLRRIGVPDGLLPLIRQIQDKESLKNHEKELPPDAFENLYFLAEGVSYNEVVDAASAVNRKVDIEDLDAALELPVTRRHFVRVDDMLLEEIYRGSLEKWRIFLHPEQRRMVEIKAAGPVRVLGGAGTGKTVVAMHRAKWLASKVFVEPGDRILFMTYNTNLAAYIERQLASLCSLETLDRIEVVNVDRWVHQSLYRRQIYFKPTYQNEKAREAWKKAVALLPAGSQWNNVWLRDEYDAVVLANGVNSEREYLTVSRTGRGTRLSRSARSTLWPVFQAYQDSLRSLSLMEREDTYRTLARLIQEDGSTRLYRAVIIDEAQDMSMGALRLIRSIVPEGPNDLFIVGDPHQRIYGRPVVFKACGINIAGRGRRLRINYRTPEEVRAWACTVLSGVRYDDMDGNADSNKGYLSLIHGEGPKICHYGTLSEEQAAVAEHIAQLGCGDRLHTICLVARTHSQCSKYAKALRNAGIDTHLLGKQADNTTIPGVRVGTMHRVKGIEFDHMIAAGVQAGRMPLVNYRSAIDQVARSHVLQRERSLLYVVATRARKTLLITGHGGKSEFLEESITSDTS